MEAEMESNKAICATSAPAPSPPSEAKVSSNDNGDQTQAQQAARDSKEDAADAPDASTPMSTNGWEDWQAFDDGLFDALEKVQATGSFASFYRTKPVEPELVVHDVGVIKFPLDQPQARAIIEKARQAPFGKGSDTVVDTSVRNTWELDPAQFEVRSPGWPETLTQICHRVAVDLGIDAPIIADLYKLLIYEEGAMFKAHVDTEKIPGMFGTLVICLPSPHEGGDVVVRHRGQEKTFKTSEAECSFACWYSDVFHEVLPVTSGYRVVLTYNLALDPTREIPSAGLRRAENRELRHTLRRWLQSQDGQSLPDHVYYRLDHEYTEASISMNALKTRDLSVVRNLDDLSTELDFDIFLAVLERSEMGDVEHHGGYRDDYYGYRSRYDDYDDEDEDEDEDDGEKFHELTDVIEETLEVKLLVDLRGNHVLRGISLDGNHILGGGLDCFDGAEPEESYEPFMGNSGPTATHFYRVSALLLIPRKKTPGFLKSSAVGEFINPVQQKMALSYLMKFVEKQAAHREAAFSAIQDIWDKLTTYHVRVKFVPEEEMKMLKTAIRLERWDFFEKLAENFHSTVPSEFFEWLSQQVVEGKVEFETIKTGLTSMVLGCDDFEKRVSKILSFTTNTSPMSDELRRWALETVEKDLSRPSQAAPLTASDGKAVFEVAEKLANVDWIVSTIAPLVEKHLDQKAFVLTFLSQLFTKAKAKQFPPQEGAKLYKQVAKAFISNLDFSKVAPVPAPPLLDPRGRFLGIIPAAVEPNPCADLGGDMLAEFFSGLIKLSLPPREDLVMPLALKVVGHASNIPAPDFHTLWIPFLQNLLAVLEYRKIPLTTPRYQQIFGAILEAYRDNFLGQKPPPGHVDASMRLSYCSCNDCTRLNAFLRDPSRRECRFPVSKSRRHHLHKMIERESIDCTHVSDRSGPQDSLAVTKRTVSQQAGWETRIKKAGEMFQSFDQTKLGLLLGNDYPSIAQALWQRPANLVPGRGGISYAMPPVRVPAPAVDPPFPTLPPAPYGVVPMPGGSDHSHGQGWAGAAAVPQSAPANPPFPTLPPARYGVQPPAHGDIPGHRHGQGWSGSAGVTAPPPKTFNGPLAPMAGNATGPSPGRLPGHGSVAPPSVVGTKRKAEDEIIDLT